MAGSASGQDEVNHVMWLTTRVGKMGLSCPLGICRFIPTKSYTKAKFFSVIFWPYNKSFILLCSCYVFNKCLTTVGREQSVQRL